MHNKHLIRLFFILTFLFLSSGAYLLLPDKPRAETPKPTIKNLSWTNVATNTVIGKDKTVQKSILSPTSSKTIIEPKTDPSPTATNTQKQENFPLNIIVNINDQKYLVGLPDKSTAYDAMIKLQTEGKITLGLKEYSGMGYFIEEINGIKNNGQMNKYWIYYINGQSAKIGVSSYILKNNDLITWEYATPKF